MPIDGDFSRIALQDVSDLQASLMKFRDSFHHLVTQLDALEADEYDRILQSADSWLLFDMNNALLRQAAHVWQLEKILKQNVSDEAHREQNQLDKLGD